MTQTTLIRTYKGTARKSTRKFQNDANKLAETGYRVQTQSTRSKRWSFLTGFFTNKQVITVTYVRG